MVIGYAFSLRSSSSNRSHLPYKVYFVVKVISSFLLRSLRLATLESPVSLLKRMITSSMYIMLLDKNPVKHCQVVFSLFQFSESRILTKSSVLAQYWQGQSCSIDSSASVRVPVKLEWRNLSYSILFKDPECDRKCRKQRIRKHILNSVSGVATPGTCIAIMGPSGSGKTTLLNALAGRVVAQKGSVLGGEVLVNGAHRSSLGAQFNGMASYVEQDDTLFSFQTVRETLSIAADLRLPRDLSSKQKADRVDGVIAAFGLRDAEHTLIGNARTRGVSGGERKRVSVGVELLKNPSLLFLDEPTSGLDAFQALNVLKKVKALCKSGATVIVTIHQPRSALFALFDHLILLSAGNVIYDGPSGQSVVDYFGLLGFKCPDLFNPADFLLDVLSIDDDTESDRRKWSERMDCLMASQRKRTARRMSIECEKSESTQPSHPMQQMTVSDSFQSSFITQIRALSLRSFRQLTRDKRSLRIRIATALFFSCFLAALYSDMANTDNVQQLIQDKSGILFFVAMNLSFGGIINTVNSFVVEIPIILKERQSKLYYQSSYYITKVITAMPIDLIPPIFYSSIIYWIAGLNPDIIAFGIFTLIAVCITFAAIGLGFMTGAIGKTMPAAYAIGPPVGLLMVLFGGFYLNTDNMPIWCQWMKNISIIHWAFAAFIINEFDGVTFECAQGEALCVENGEQVIETMSFEQYSICQCVLYLVALIVLFHSVSFMLLKFGATQYLEVTTAGVVDVLGSNEHELSIVADGAKQGGNAKETNSK